MANAAAAGPRRGSQLLRDTATGAAAAAPAGAGEAVPATAPAPPIPSPEELAAAEEEAELKAKLELKAAPIREYLEGTVIPLLLKGLQILAIERPENPIDFLAHYLLEKNPTPPVVVEEIYENEVTEDKIVLRRSNMQRDTNEFGADASSRPWPFAEEERSPNSPLASSSAFEERRWSSTPQAAFPLRKKASLKKIATAAAADVPWEQKPPGTFPSADEAADAWDKILKSIKDPARETRALFPWEKTG